ncbi:MAG TPA: hypothetical protein VHR42_05275 [Clostridia bacterium]|nr:hypothetical protein [Clostridia bacterium]
MQRDINFFSVYHSSADHGGVDRTTLIGGIVTIASVVIVLGAFLLLKIGTAGLSMQSQSISQFLARPDVSAATSRVNEIYAKNNYLDKYQSTASSNIKKFYALTKFDSKLIDLISKAAPADVTASDLNFGGNIVSLTCTATDERSPANFVHTLSATGSFEQVTYDGVIKDSNSQYTFSVDCIMKGESDK